MQHLSIIYTLGGSLACFAEELAWRATLELSGKKLSVIELCLAIGMLGECAREGPVRFSDTGRFASKARYYSGELRDTLAGVSQKLGDGAETVRLAAFALLWFPHPHRSLSALRSAANGAAIDASGVDEAERALAEKTAKK
jgi:hypothetical protein